jgi:hypothetical protein
MARPSHSAYVDLRFGYPVRQFLDFAIGVSSDNFAREGLCLFGPNRIGTNRNV